MPTIPYDKAPKWEHGTAKEVTAILRDKGQKISYDAVCKRLTRLSDYETVKLAVQVSKRRRETRQARNENMRRLISLAKRETQS
jgi:hypothetical protein